MSQTNGIDRASERLGLSVLSLGSERQRGRRDGAVNLGGCIYRSQYRDLRLYLTCTRGSNLRTWDRGKSRSGAASQSLAMYDYS